MGIYDPNGWPGPRNAGLRSGLGGNPHEGRRKLRQSVRLAVTIGLAVGVVAALIILMTR